MLPYLLAGLGSYFIGQNTTQKFSDGGRIRLGEPMEFETEIHYKDVSTHSLNTYLGVSEDAPVYDDAGYFTIYYTLTPEITSWGIKQIYVHIKKVEGAITWEADLKELSKEDRDILEDIGYPVWKKKGVIVKTIYCEDLPFEIKTDVDFDNDGRFNITDVHIDFKDKVIELK